jgi:hypothetical protein
MFEELSHGSKSTFELWPFAIKIGGVDSWPSSCSGGGYYDSNISKELRDIYKEIGVILTVDDITLWWHF